MSDPVLPQFCHSFYNITNFCLHCYSIVLFIVPVFTPVCHSWVDTLIAYYRFKKGEYFGEHNLKQVKFLCDGENCQCKNYSPKFTLVSEGGISPISSNGNKGDEG